MLFYSRSSFVVLICTTLFIACKKDDPRPPLITTINPSNITASSAQCGGVLYHEGDEPVTEKGLCWSAHSEPDLQGPHMAAAPGLGNFTMTMNGLTSGNYYVRAYAKTDAGETYGRSMKFVVPFGFMTDVDGNQYRTVKIGGQVWMTENLRVTRYRDGTPIPYTTLATGNWSTTTHAYCVMDDNMGNLQQYGALYNAYVVHNSKKIAPVGWHVPSLNELQILINTLGAENAAVHLKKQEGGHWGSDLADNSSGFDAMPSGTRYTSYQNKQTELFCWLSTPDYSYSTDVTYSFGILKNYNTVWYDGSDNRMSYSIRLIKD